MVAWELGRGSRTSKNDHGAPSPRNSTSGVIRTVKKSKKNKENKEKTLDVLTRSQALVVSAKNSSDSLLKEGGDLTASLICSL